MRRLKKQQLRSDAQLIRTISVILISLGNLTKVLQASPRLPTTPSTESMLKLKPMFRRWLITARTVAAVHEAASDLTHRSAAKE